MTSRTLATARSTPLPPYRFGSPSRSSTASRWPVEAPDGTAAVPRAPPARVTVASTVGKPRESRISRAEMVSIAAIAFPSGRLLARAARLAHHDDPHLREERHHPDHPPELETGGGDLPGEHATGEPRAPLGPPAERAPQRAHEALQRVGVADRGNERPAPEPGERVEHAGPAGGGQVHQEARAHHRVDAPWPERRQLEVRAHVADRAVALAGDGQHGGRDVGPDDAQPAAGEERAEDARAARGVEDERARGEAGERTAERPLEQPVVQPPDRAPVAAALVAARVELAVAPAGVVVGGRRPHDRRTLTAAPAACNCS